MKEIGFLALEGVGKNWEKSVFGKLLLASHTHPPRQGGKGDAGVATGDDDFVESSQADGRPVRSKHQVARFKASSQGAR